MTLIGPPMPAAPMPAQGELPRLVANEDISEVGAHPLFSDPKLGWETSVRLVAPSDGSHTRLPSEPNDYRIRSSRWIVYAILLLIGVAIGVAAVLMT